MEARKSQRAGGGEVVMHFLEYFNEYVDRIQLVRRKDSLLMWIIHYVLKFANLFTRKELANGDFIKSYTTTIGNTIYSSPAWDTTKSVNTTIVHELTHVLQRGAKFYVLYVISAKMRLYYESEAFQTELLCFVENPNRISLEAIKRRAIFLETYGIDKNDAFIELEKRVSEVRRGEPKEIPLTIKNALESWRKTCQERA